MSCGEVSLVGSMYRCSNNLSVAQYVASAHATRNGQKQGTRTAAGQALRMKLPPPYVPPPLNRYALNNYHRWAI